MPVIAPPTPATGLLVRRPFLQVFIGGQWLPYVLEMTTTRGLDQEVATADIVYPYPLPDGVHIWSKVQIIVGADDGLGDSDPFDPPNRRPVERFTGYVINVGSSLWPGAVTLHCEDVLALAKYTYTPEEMSLQGETDISAIRRILGPAEGSNLGGVGIPFTMMTLGGLDKPLVDFDDVTLIWDVGQTALEAIKAIDSQSLGYRTTATVGGRIIRTLIVNDPNTVAYTHHFREGVDILDGSETKEIKDAKNEITVTGFDETVQAKLPEDEDPFYWRRNSYWIRFLALKAEISGSWVSSLQVAEYILSQLNRNLIKVTFSTHRSVLFTGLEVVKVTSPHLEVDQHFWVQSVQLSLGADGALTQTLTCVGELDDSTNRRLVPPPIATPIGVVPGVPVVINPVPVTPVAPSPADLLASFTQVAVDRQLAAPADLPDDTGGSFYGVTSSDTSTSRQGQIVAWTWAATGPGVVVASGTEPTFTTAFSDLTGAEITLTVEDSNGNTATITQPAYDGASPVQARTLFACTETTMEAFDGTEWRQATPAGAATVQCVGAGPVWGCDNLVATSSDFLATAPVEVAALPGGENVIAIWVHENNPQHITVGGDAGSLAVSHDGGATFTPKTSPGSVVNFVIVSIFDQTEIHAVTPEGWFKSQNEGDSWDLVRAGSFRYLELAPARNIVITTDGVLQKGEDGTPFTGNTSPIVAATAHIRQDSFYGISEDGTTWACEPGGFTLTAREPIPSGVPYHAGAYRDGQMVDLVYFAAQSDGEDPGGLFKTLDGFRTPQGYQRLRAIGRLTP